MIRSKQLLGALAVAFVLAAAVVYGQDNQLVSEVCLGCICNAISGCNRTLTCSGDVCGIFRITWAYWSDAGKPVIEGDDPAAQGAYPRCVNEPYCAAATVRGYMARFRQDCNGDGVINCDDYARLHLLGGYGCGGNLTPLYQQRYVDCRSQFDVNS
ncbi:lysozyme-like [Ischnura elegans]|uniref:lysozyme-like n=1 Tax=Ischnura elegans TaxID=197161 RepID=UPI001ED8AA45|nr:lysozyme-like [Ischnura elegans]